MQGAGCNGGVLKSHSSFSFSSDEKSHARLSLNRVFYNDRWSKNRCVTSMDWSTYFPELLLSSYHSNIVSDTIISMIFKLSLDNDFVFSPTGISERTRRCGHGVEYEIQERNGRRCFPLPKCCNVRMLCKVSSEFDFGWNIFGTNCIVG